MTIMPTTFLSYTTPILCYFIGLLTFVSSQEELICDKLRAEDCIKQLQSGYLDVTTHKDSEKLNRLCIGVNRGNNLTECVLEATSACDWKDPWPMGEVWAKLHVDIRARCNKACPKFVKRLKSASDCAKKIHYEDVTRGDFNQFCVAMNVALRCIEKHQSNCSLSLISYITGELPAFVTSFFDICSRGCRNLNDIMAAARECASKYDLSSSLTRQRWCNDFTNFNDCLAYVRTKDPCLNVGDLFEKVNGNFSIMTKRHVLYCSSVSSNSQGVHKYHTQSHRGHAFESLLSWTFQLFLVQHIISLIVYWKTASS